MVPCCTVFLYASDLRWNTYFFYSAFCKNPTEKEVCQILLCQVPLQRYSPLEALLQVDITCTMVLSGDSQRAETFTESTFYILLLLNLLLMLIFLTCYG